MEELFQRFPHLYEGIFNSLDNQSCSNCRIANKSWRNYLDQQKFFQIRNIKESIPKCHEIGEPWELIFRKAGIDILRKLVYAVRKSFKICRSKDYPHFYCIFAGEVFDQGTPIDHFGKSQFATDVSSWEHFGTCTIRCCRRSSRWTFQHGKISTWGLFGTRSFRHKEFSARGIFGMGTFRHMDISA